MENEVAVLLVEDEPMVALVMEEDLTEAGFKVYVATNGSEALAVLDNPTATIHALVTDIRLPGKLTGWDIAHRAREKDATLPVIYASGDSGRQWNAHGVPGSIMLSKPFAVAQLIMAVSQLQNARSMVAGCRTNLILPHHLSASKRSQTKCHS